jgi:hypothetical protein
MGHPMKNVLTAKKARFLLLLAGKRGWASLKKAFYFALFHVLVVFQAWRLLPVRVFRYMGASPKNRAEKPTVGFWMFGRGVIIAR